MSARKYTLKSGLVAVAFAATLAGFGPVQTVSAGKLNREPVISAWSVASGHVGLRWNKELLREFGVSVKEASEATTALTTGRYALSSRSALVVNLTSGKLSGFQSGELVAQGGPRLGLRDRVVDLSQFRLRPVAGEPFVLDLVSQDGIPWFRLVRPMYEFSDNRREVDVSTMDMTVSLRLAEALGRPEASGWTIADVSIAATTTALPAPQAPAEAFHWPGDPAPNGGVYRADLFMKEMQFQYSRCSDDCTGPTGSGRVVFTPSSTLRNNGNNGYVTGYTVPNDPLGASSALWPAGIAWYPKFSGEFPPYQNDQHPYLVWNMYRLDPGGSIQQIGRSGVKHAYLTNNFFCFDPDDHSPHVLGRGCEDTYTVSHNDNSEALGPRSEIIPATGQWARCGSVYDPSCSGTSSSSGNSSFDQRLVVSESQISASANPGATYLFESWYVARDDINIYNSMATVRTVPAYTTGWNVNVQSNYRLGPAIDRWVDPVDPGEYAASTELVTPEGRAKVAVRVKWIGSQYGGWRYTYAFANFDFARVAKEGSEPNLRLLKSDGFDRFSIAVGSAAVTEVQFHDGDSMPSNDWQFSQQNGDLVFTAPVDGNQLEWGSLYSVSFMSAQAPVVSSVDLRVADGGAPAHFLVDNLKAPAPGDVIWRQGFEP